MSNTVSLCMIVKNEISNMGRLLDTVLPVLEEVIIVDTGSTDGTLELLQERAQKSANLKVERFTWIKDFSAARNFGIEKATQSWLMWVDGDDAVCQKSLKKFKDEVLDSKPNVDCWMLDYIYSKFPDGTPRTLLTRERFLRLSKKPRFVGAIHETIDINCFRTEYYPDLKIVHEPAGKHIDYNRNVEILATEFEKNPKDPRTAYYYGKELFDRINPKGIEILEHYLTLPGRWWDDECNARFKLARHYLSVKKHREALEVIERVYHLDFSRRRAEYYWMYGAVEMDIGNFEIAIDWFNRCFVQPPPNPRVLSLEYYGWNPHKQISECAKRLSKWDLMMKHRVKVVEALPGDVEAVKWAEELLLALAAKKGRVLINLNRDRRFLDSHWIGDFPQADIVCNPGNGIPVRTESVDRVILTDRLPGMQELKEIFRILKPTGIFCSSPDIGEFDPEDFGALFKYPKKVVVVDDVGKEVPCKVWVKVDPEKKSTFSFGDGDINFGPYRIQVDLLRRSLIRAGYRETKNDPDYHIASVLRPDVRAKKKVLMLCEWLPESDYSGHGLERADILLASSRVLAERLREKFLDKPVAALEDHFEIPVKEWYE